MDKITDIYDLTKFVNDIQKKFIEDENQETLSMGIFGYLNEFNSIALQNATLNAAEWGNEAIPTKSKFERTILTNAVTYNIENINAIPSQMKVMIGFIKNELDDHLDNNKLIINKDSPIMIENFEFHLDYDILITRTKLRNGKYTYSAKYIIDKKNNISDIINPYLQSPFMITKDNSGFLMIIVTIRQIEIKKEYKKIISRNILENKAFEFTFIDHLADFEIDVEENNETKHITPIFDGMPPVDTDDYCFYNYVDGHTIRVKFDRTGYSPKLNANICVTIKTTRGSEGNFKYKEDILTSLESKEDEYKTLNTLIRPVTDSMLGIDRKSVKELKDMIPKEILSRGSIINNKDLENYFNMIDDNNKIYLFRKRDNQIERLYYAYLIAKDELDNIVPTNTINIKSLVSDFDAYNDTRYIIKPGRAIELKGDFGKLSKYDSDKDYSNSFLYASPFLMVLNKNPLSLSYYLTIMDRDYDFDFSYINNNSDLQFISNKLNIYKNYIESDKYIIHLTLMQNIDIYKGLIDLDDKGNMTNAELKVVLILEQEQYKYYTFGKIIDFDSKSFSYDIEFELDTDNLIDRENRIKIKNIYQNGTDTLVDIFFDETIKMSIATFIPQSYSLYDKNDIINIPSLNSYILTNHYTTMEKVHLFYNYSQIMNSTVVLDNSEKPENNDYNFIMRNVPLVKYSYLNNIDRCNQLIDYLQYRKAYIDTALDVLENSFTIDLKFFNTYGPSKSFTIGYEGERLDKVNISMVFKIKTITGFDKHIKEYIIADIKEYMENINTLTDTHMSNLTAYIKDKYKSDLEFIEFVKINNYNSTYQYIEREDHTLIEEVPEFLTINLANDVNPDIEIISL